MREYMHHILQDQRTWYEDKIFCTLQSRGSSFFPYMSKENCLHQTSLNWCDNPIWGQIFVTKLWKKYWKWIEYIFFSLFLQREKRGYLTEDYFSLVCIKSIRPFPANELNKFRSHLWWNTNRTVVFVEPNCRALCLQDRLHKTIKVRSVTTVSETMYRWSSGQCWPQTSWFGSLNMKWSMYMRAAEEPEILTFTTNLSPL